MADARCLIVGQIEWQSAGNLFRTPCACPRRSCRGPCRRPFQDAVGPATGTPVGATTKPAKRSCTDVCKAVLSANFACFGRRADRSACHCAVVARYARPLLRWRRCASALARWSMLPARADERLPAWCSFVPGEARSPPVLQTINTGLRAALPMEQTSLVAYRLPFGTVLFR